MRRRVSSERFGRGDRARESRNRPVRPLKVRGEFLEARDITDEEHRPELQCARYTVFQSSSLWENVFTIR